MNLKAKINGKKILIRILRTIALAYVLGIIVLFFLEPYLLFPGSPIIAGEPQKYGLLNFKKITLNTGDGVTITGWFKQTSRKRKTIIYFYGNGDSLANYPSFFKKLGDAGYSVLAINYHGYSDSGGKPSETALYDDSMAALKFAEQFTPEKDIILVGRSLGSGVATDLASKTKPGGLVLISAFTSIPDVAANIYPFLPVHLIARYEFNSLDKIPAVKCPILLLHGDKDTLVLPSSAQLLFDAAKSEKKLKYYQNYDHLNIPYSQIADDIIQFANAVPK